MATNPPVFASMDEAELSAAIKSARTSLEDAVAAFKELAHRRSPQLPEVARAQLKSARAPVALRNAAAVALGEEQHADNQAALLKQLAPDSPVLIKHVAQSLGRIGDKRALAKLDALPEPARPSDAAAVRFARSLIAYRLQLGSHQIAPAPASKRLVPDADKANRLAVGPLKDTARSTIEREWHRHAPGIALTDTGALEFRCRNSQFLIVMTRAFAEAPDAAAFARTGGVLALVFKQSPCAEDSSFDLYEYIFVNPAEGDDATLVGVRASGQTVHSGEITLAPGGTFALAAENSLHTTPLTLSGSFSREGRRAALDAIVVSDERAEGQAKPAVPRAFALEDREPPRASA